MLLFVRGRPYVQPQPADVLAADGSHRWFRGNLHTHTLWSDGDDYPEMVALWYREHGYDFLGFTDHNTLLGRQKWIDPLSSKGKQRALDKLRDRFPDGWIDERTGAKGNPEIRLKTFDEIVAKIGLPGQFLLIQGEEISDKFGNLPVHMNATNVKEAIPPLGGNSVLEVMQRNTDALVAQRERTRQPMLIHLNHPNFHYAITAEDLARVRGENFFEVYNGHPTVYNDGDELHTSCDRIWDVLLTLRLTDLRLPLMYGLATDDGHEYHNIPSRNSEPGRGWIMVLARELSPASLIEALEAGRFYASSGVRLDEVAVSESQYTVRVHGEAGVEYTIEFLGTRTGFDPTSESVLGKNGVEIHTTRRYSRDIGRVMKSVAGTTATYELTADDLYVRARITSTKMHPNPSAEGEFERAWTQPVKGPAAR